MNRATLLAIFLVVGTFAACNNGDGDKPATANSVRSSCRTGQLYSSQYNQCLNQENCPSGQGWLSSESRCVTAELIGPTQPTPPNDNPQYKAYRYTGSISISTPQVLQTLMKSVGLCTENSLSWCWPNKCPQDCAAWSAAILYFEATDQTSTPEGQTTINSYITILPQQNWMAYGMPISVPAVYTKGTTTGFTSKGNVPSYMPGTSGYVEVRVGSGDLGNNSLYGEVYYNNYLMGAVNLTPY